MGQGIHKLGRVILGFVRNAWKILYSRNCNQSSAAMTGGGGGAVTL